MKLNYYMRGLGVGIVVTALLMGIALSGRKDEMTDEEIRQRALEMGMVDGNMVLADMPENREEESPVSSSQNGIAGNTEENGPDEEADKETDREEGKEEPEREKTEISGNEENESEEAENPLDENVIVNETIIITINSGDGSRVVANKLLQAGMIEDAAAFDEFLCQNGYDKRLASGAHEIPADASDEEIARILMQRPGRR